MPKKICRKSPDPQKCFWSRNYYSFDCVQIFRAIRADSKFEILRSRICCCICKCIWIEMFLDVPLWGFCGFQYIRIIFFNGCKSLYCVGFFGKCAIRTGFRTFKLSESLWNRFKTILLDQKMNFKKNPIEKYFFIMEKNDFEKKVRKKIENFDFFNWKINFLK